MARKPHTPSETPPVRKIRTREHVIASQSVAHVERFIAAAGHTAERFANDYGYDLTVSTFTSDQEAEPGNIFVQIKATDRLKLLRDAKTISFPVEWRDIALWREELMPVILVVYDVTQETAYWLYMQQFCEASAEFQAAPRSGTIAVHLPNENVLDKAAIETFRQFKRVVFDQTKGKVKHNG